MRSQRLIRLTICQGEPLSGDHGRLQEHVPSQSPLALLAATLYLLPSCTARHLFLPGSPLPLPPSCSPPCTTTTTTTTSTTTTPQRQRETHRHRLESKRPRVNEDKRNSRLRKCPHATSEVWEKRQSEDLGRQEHSRVCHLGTKKRDHVRFRRLCMRSLSCLRSNLLCCVCSLRMILLGPGRLVLRR